MAAEHGRRSATKLRLNARLENIALRRKPVRIREILTLASDCRRIAGVSMSEPIRLSAILVRVEDVRDETQRTVVNEWRLQDWRNCACIRCDNKFKRAPEAFVVAFAAIGAVAEVCGVCNKCRHLKDDVILRAGLAYAQGLSPAAMTDTAP